MPRKAFLSFSMATSSVTEKCGTSFGAEPKEVISIIFLDAKRVNKKICYVSYITRKSNHCSEFRFAQGDTINARLLDIIPRGRPAKRRTR